MPGRNSQINHQAAITKALEAQPRAEAVREHLKRILESPAFKTSDRSREFLAVIVDKALAGHFEELKERVLGVELFGRKTSYDTSEDAVVRVTASDVRKRLLRFYSETGPDSDLRLEIPVGSYIPEFRWGAHGEGTPEDHAPLDQAHLADPISDPGGPMVLGSVVEVRPTIGPPAPMPVRRASWNNASVGLIAGLVLGVLVSVVTARLTARSPAKIALPWSALFQNGRSLQIILSDTEISKMQNYLGYSLALPDYANHKYLPPEVAVPPALTQMLGSFRGLSMGAGDVAIALDIANRAFSHSQVVAVLPARGVQLKDFRTDDNFVMLGSPRSDPWVSLFQNQLDFQFEYDSQSAREVIRNLRPQGGEPAIYRPSARGWDTGDAFGIVAFLANPNQSGHVLLLAGSNAEATEAAAKFVLSSDLLWDVLKKNGIAPDGSAIPFQILLHVNTMAGSANNFEPVAFHRPA